MTSHLTTAFETVLSKAASADEKKAAHHIILDDYSKGKRLPLDDFCNFANAITHISLITLFSDLLDHYAPSYAEVPKENRASGWAFFDALGEASRKADQSFFDGLWQKKAAEGHGLTSPLGEVVAFSRVKHSGWFSEEGFSRKLMVFEKTYGGFPLERVLDYESEDDLCFPDLFVLRWFMGAVVLLGELATVKMLTVACERSETDTFFDLEDFWINHHEQLKAWFHMPFGKMVSESVRVLKGLREST